MGGVQTNKQTNKQHERYKSVLTQGCVGDAIHLQDEVVFEENVANDGEQVDEDERQHSGEHDGASVTSHTLDHVQQRLLSVYEVEQLPRQSTRDKRSEACCHLVRTVGPV